MNPTAADTRELTNVGGGPVQDHLGCLSGTCIDGQRIFNCHGARGADASVVQKGRPVSLLGRASHNQNRSVDLEMDGP